jgi:predicted nuclease with TOPRIM domain
LIGSIPCLITFLFENEYSYFREKVISYKVIVRPPSLDTLRAGRRRRAKACLDAVEDDCTMAANKLESVTHKRNTLEQEMKTLQEKLEQMQKIKTAMEQEETKLKNKVELRTLQAKALIDRLEEGWEDERESKPN